MSESDLVSPRVRASAMAGEFFDDLVQEQLEGRGHEVRVSWGDDQDQEPTVWVDGVDVRDIVTMCMSDIGEDQELIDAACTETTEHLAQMWESTMDYHRDLTELSPIMAALADSSRFRDAAVAEYKELGVEPTLTDIEATAKALACTAFRAWCAALEENEDA